MSSFFDQLVHVLQCEMRREKSDRREMNRTLGESFQKDRKTPRRPCGNDSTVSFVFEEMKNFNAIRKDRGTAFPQVKFPFIEFRQVRHEVRRRPALRPDQCLDPSDELRIRELCRVSESVSRHADIL